MSWLPTALAALVLAAWLLAAWELGRGRRRVGRLAEVDPATLPVPAPAVTIAIAARDEAPHIEAALRSVLALDYPALQVVVVDDRSSDGTGAILDALAAREPRLAVHHVTALPDGWLGKNHALDLVGRAARGEWVLFTDADVHFAPDALTRAVAHAERAGLDHLVLGPRMVGGTPAMRVMLAFFALSFALNTRPWRAREPRRREHIGIGAFNLVRRRALAAVGGHARIALRPDDDLKLGKLLKDAGHAQEFMDGSEAVSVAWYRSAWEMVRGLEKNSFPFLDYSVPRTLGALFVTWALVLWPLQALATASGAALALHAATVAVTLALCAASAQRTVALSPWAALGYPLGALLLMLAIANSMLRTLWQGGVRWRGTLYPLAALKANRV